ncbi:MAG: CDP-diacylglycerol--glycerol-3-phosphate 3-phosphatidyltransferase [Bacilli bacterium]|nr:CDP-diacylglycerol--glycerol-3-phosphate 3-phosphatidyltransferase [Bacilli bacterium]
MNIPTKITMARIVLVVAMLLGLFVCSLIPDFQAPLLGDSGINLVYLLACVVFIVASTTDWLDGYLARKWHQVTDLGKFLDPIADKLLVNSSLIFLVFPFGFATGQTTFIPVFCVIVMIARDLVVDALRLVAAKKNEVIAANIFGKLKTVFQMVAIPFVFLNGWPFNQFDASWPSALRITMWLVYLATAMSLISGVIYVVQNFRVLKEKQGE